MYEFFQTGDMFIFNVSVLITVIMLVLAAIFYHESKFWLMRERHENMIHRCVSSLLVAVTVFFGGPSALLYLGVGLAFLTLVVVFPIVGLLKMRNAIRTRGANRRRVR